MTGMVTTPKKAPTPEPKSHRTIPLWAFIAALVGLTGVFVVTMALIVSIDRRDEREDAQEELDLNFLNCLRGNELRFGLIANEMEPATPLDLTVLPSVRAAPSWFLDVTAEIKALGEAAQTRVLPEPDSRTERRVVRWVKQVRDCEKEWAGHTPGLRLPHEETPPPTELLEHYKVMLTPLT